MKKSCQPQPLPDHKPTSPKLTDITLTVAQRRALFEQNIAAQHQVKKPSTTNTTIVTISLTKTTATSSVDTATTCDQKELVDFTVDRMTTPPHSIPYSKTTPPSRRGTRPRENLFAATNGLINTSPKQRNAWTPPCIKNVLLKKQLIVEMNEDQKQISENETTGTNIATSSPIHDTSITSAGMIIFCLLCIYA